MPVEERRRRQRERFYNWLHGLSDEQREAYREKKRVETRRRQAAKSPERIAKEKEARRLADKGKWARMNRWERDRKNARTRAWRARKKEAA